MQKYKIIIAAFSLTLAIGGATFSCKTPKEATTETATGKTTAFTLPYEKFVLANGLEVILHADHSDPIVAVATVMHVGSNREKPGKTGFAHFFEHMSFNDSENTPVGASRKLVPEWGGERNGGTWSDGTIYYEVVPKDAFDKILWMDSDRLGYMIKTVTEEALAREIQVVKNEKRQNYDNAAYGFTDEIIRKNLYPPDHPYNWTVIGQLPDLQSATLADVKEFYNQYYGPNNATLVIAGDINIAETKAKVERWFGEIPKGPEVKPLPPMPVTLKEVKSLYLEDNFAKLPELRLVFPTVENYHPDTYALNILGMLLSGNRNAPLYKILVEEKQLAPGLNAYQSSNELAGEFTLRVRANANVPLQNVHAAVQAGWQRFETEGFSDKALERIRAQIETDLYGGLESVLSKASRMGRDNEFAGDPAHITKAAALTRAVTREDVMRVYAKYLKNKPYVMTSVVPKGQKELIVSGAVPATVFQEQVVAGVQNEEVGQGQEARFEKTVTKHDRSEPPFSEMPLFKMPAIWTNKLPNGLQLYGIENTEVPLVTFDITIPGGHYLDPLDKAGTAALMAQLLMQGTAQKTPAQLEEAIDLLGANISVYSTFEEIRLQGRCLARNFAPTLALAREILLQPRWDEGEFNRLKKALQTNLGGNVYFIDVPDAKQSVLYLGKLALAGKDPQRSQLVFANELLGGGSSGRLFQTLRIQKGYTYGAYSAVQQLNEIAPFTVNTSVRANATLPSLQLVRQMIQDYGPSFSEADMAVAKNKILKSNTLAYESLGAKLGLLREISKYGKSPKFVEEDQQALMRMTLPDFKNIIGKHLAEKDLVHVVVGDKATQYNEVKKFADGPFILLDIQGKAVK